ncbi:flagellar hook-length control protein FliK, partial [bacterium]|nr:flagellar hook-length control protein FliK [candidate division CSSED10-310 bacterium]
TLFHLPAQLMRHDREPADETGNTASRRERIASLVANMSERAWCGRDAEGNPRLHLSLNEAEGGELHLDLFMEGDLLHAVITADESMARDLRSRAEQLEVNLKAIGLEPGKLEIRTQADGSGSRRTAWMSQELHGGAGPLQSSLAQRITADSPVETSISYQI